MLSHICSCNQQGTHTHTEVRSMNIPLGQSAIVPFPHGSATAAHNESLLMSVSALIRAREISVFQAIYAGHGDQAMKVCPLGGRLTVLFSFRQSSYTELPSVKSTHIKVHTFLPPAEEGLFSPLSFGWFFMHCITCHLADTFIQSDFQ